MKDWLERQTIKTQRMYWSSIVAMGAFAVVGGFLAIIFGEFSSLVQIGILLGGSSMVVAFAKLRGWI